MPTIYNFTLIPDIVAKAKGSNRHTPNDLQKRRRLLEQTMASLSDSQNGCGGDKARLAVSGVSVDMKSTLLVNGLHLLLEWFGNTTWCDNMGGQLVANKVKIESPKS